MHATFSELRAFEATATAGSMSAAARALGLSQPTISAHIAALERAYGVELFFRRGRRVELTEFGRTLHEVTLRMERAEGEALALLQAARNSYRGRLRISAVGPYNVTPMLKRFRERWPAIELVVSVGDSRDIVDRVLRYEADVGVLVHGLDDPRLHCMPYRRQRLTVFAHVDHPMAALGRVRLADLAGAGFVMREEGSTTRSVFEAALLRAGVSVRTTIEMGSREAVREAVAQGLGLGVVADTAYVADPRLVPIPIEGTAPETHSHVICLAERRDATHVRRFFEIVDALRAATGDAAPDASAMRKPPGESGRR